MLVYIHGGGFAEGCGDRYGPQYLMDKNVVVVTVNSRLGIFGKEFFKLVLLFLSLMELQFYFVSYSLCPSRPQSVGETEAECHEINL